MQKQPELPHTAALSTRRTEPHHGTNPHRQKQSLHQRERRARRIHSVGNGREGQHSSSEVERGGTLGVPPSPVSFLHFSQSWLGAVTLESGEHVPALPSLIPSPKPCLPISHPVLLPQEAGGEVQKRVYAAQRTKLGRPRPEAVTVGGSG